MSPFKVIIVGGGPSGITTAHALLHAGIDFVVLERRQNVFEDTGASLVLSPQNLRVFHQLGILDQFIHLGAPLLHLSQSFSPTSKSFTRTHSLSRIQDNHGSALIIFHRAVLLKALYDSLPQDGKDRYLVNKTVNKVEISDEGVEVTCEDGSSYSGAIVIGADGVHSKTRLIMKGLAPEAVKASWSPETVQLAPQSMGPLDNAFPATYKCLWGSLDRETQTGESYEIQSHNRSAMYLTGKDKAWIFLYEKLPQPTTQRAVYDKAAATAFAESFSHWRVHENLTIGDIISRTSFASGLNDLQEGTLQEKSSGGRIVLVGDACHRFTPNAGLGFNNAVQDIVSLSNRLFALLQKTTNPDSKSLESLFQDYQEERRGPLKGDFSVAAKSTRQQAWASWPDYIAARWVFSFGFVKDYVTDKWIAGGIKTGRVLSFIDAPELLHGKVPWDHPLKTPPGAPEQKKS